MRVSTKQDNPPATFRPIDITITLESQQELDALYTLSQCCAVSDALHKIGLPDPLPNKVYNALAPYNPRNDSPTLTSTLRDTFKREW